ncbi:deoxyribodipyrimidine photo-lyase [Vibrio aquaticus]|uniref:Deoxyribodipyrimidine photo-lyase n=1 Tax=Vibrio aquaticus TaxID=2496559 RepID=A0A3S0P994_9VIBR|nr:deoxyribodipyrimidine photo-lyase [Vibrio aquaticus]RTZ18180.1 deoxyribodipyrimidine photo-lyase [Vibrio aquaticus]
MKIVWLRRDLRLDDNSALFTAGQSGEPTAALYVSTPETWRSHQMAPIQADLIFRRLAVFSESLASHNIKLYYAQVPTFQCAARLVAEIAASHHASSVLFNKEYEIDEQRRDSELYERLENRDIEVKGFDDKCLLKPGSVLNKQGDYFKVFTPFKKAYLAELYKTGFKVNKFTSAHEGAELTHEGVEVFTSQSPFDYPRESSEHYSVKDDNIIGQLRSFAAERIDNYHSERDIPSLSGTSQLSAYLAIGALSIRQCMARLMFDQPMPLSQGREVWQSELIWREFYQHLIYFEPKLCKGKSFVPWGDSLRWLNEEDKIEAWKQGRTGYPIVDAAMRQLNQTGWMHNRLRMVVASFLVKDLHVDWRIGEAYFISKLVDGDYAANNGGWQWCASTGCDGQPYFRIFNPVTQGEKFDGMGEFVLSWVPELSAVPVKWIHKPWMWPNAKSLSYPAPIVDHKVEREITLALYKEAKEYMNGA